MGISRGSKALVFALTALLLATVAPARAAGRQFRIGIVEFRQFSSQQGCQQLDAAADAAAGSGAPASSRLPQFSLERFKHGDCVLVKFIADGGGATTETGHAPTPDPAPTFALRFVGPNGSVVEQVAAPLLAHTDTYGAYVPIAADWPAGEYRVEAVPTSSGDTGLGRFRMTVNALGTRVLLAKPSYAPGEIVTVKGVTWKDYQIGRIVRTIVSYPEDPTRNDNVPATGTVTLRRADGKAVTKEFTSSSDAATKGEFSVDFTPAEYGNVAAGAAEGFVRTLALSARASYTDSMTGEWKTVAGDPDSEGLLQFQSKPDRPEVLAKFTSETGWVRPGQEFVHQLEYRNLSSKPAAGAVMRYEIPAAARFVRATPAPASVSGNTITWSLGAIKPGTDYGPSNRILVTLRALNEAEDRAIVWKDLSAAASLSLGGAEPVVSKTHGPRVATLETARYGDRPFPVVLIDYLDASHSASRPGWYFEQLINQPKKPSSMLNLYQEMSFGQLFPHGKLASLDAKDPTFGAAESYRWSTPLTGPSGRGACLGSSSIPPAADPATNPQSPIPSSTEFTPSGNRIVDGWYRLPGQQAYYGGDRLTYGQYAARLAGQAGLSIDNACGPTGKAAYDAASIADPDIDYNDYDTDRNGVVDFFMYISRGLGGNGASQTAGYDAIWPHSSDIQGTYINPATGEQGYVSRDQLRDRLERPLWWKSASVRRNNELAGLTTKNMGDALKAYVRVGPYNANPEISTTSVIAHEYGHSLGLPDFYSTSNRETVDFWDLMSTDNSQFMSVFSRQDLGWIVPKVLTNGSVRTTIRESKIDTHTVEWFDSKGRPYTLSGPDVHNGDAYYVPMPEFAPIEKAASGKYVYWSTRGDGFGCPGKTLDIPLHSMKSAASGDTVKLKFNTHYDIEWDYDYGFVMVSTDGGKTFTALESENGRSTPAEYNPNQVSCQEQGNGITGTSTSSEFPSNVQARTVDNEYTDAAFVADSYDLSSYAGQDVIIRFAYSTDSGLAKMGWFIDDLKVVNETKNVNYLNDNVESKRLDYVSQGWTRFLAGGGIGTDRGYYLELRDRIGFDYDGRGQSDRTAINWMPGISLWWTDEFGGYGNTGQDTATLPNQSPLDARAQNKVAVPELADAAFFDIPGLNRFNDSSHTDNYTDPNADDSIWSFKYGCFSMTVEDISGLGKPGATARLALAANGTKCRKGFGPQVLGAKITRKPAGKAPGRDLPATGAESAWFGVALLALAAVGTRRLKRAP